MMSQTEFAWLTVEEVARKWRCSRMNVIHYIRSGRLKAIRKKKMYLIPAEEVERFKRPRVGRPRKKAA
jgi:excisionase family DNA binding protein